MPLNRRSKSFRETKINRNHIRYVDAASDSQQRQTCCGEWCNERSHQKCSNIVPRPRLRREISMSLRENINNNVALAQSEFLEKEKSQSLQFMSQSVSVVPLPSKFSEELKNNALFNKQKQKLHKRHSVSVDELCNYIKNQDASNKTPKPTAFPVEEDDVELRQKPIAGTSPPSRAVRSKTVDFDFKQSSKSQKAFDIKNVYTITTEEKCAKLSKGDKLRLEAGELQIINAKGEIKEIFKRNVTVATAFTKPSSKKDVCFYDTNNVKYMLQFESTKDAKQFMESDRNRSNSLTEKNTIRFKLLRLLGKRSSRDLLESKGIYQPKPIFGNSLEKIFQDHNNTVPEFISRVIGYIEQPKNITSVGLYRTSGNLATIQKIRFEVDNGKLDILEQYAWDPDVLSGCIKLFFRELKEPLLPLSVSDQLVQLNINGSKTTSVRNILKSLPYPNYETLIVLVRHLLEVIKHKEDNKMDFYNIAVCWAPSIIFLPENCPDAVVQTTNTTKAVEMLLNYFMDNPKQIGLNDENDNKRLMRQDSKDSLKPENSLKSQKKSASCSSINNDPVHENVVKLVDLLDAHINQEGLYKKSGSTVKINKILKKLEKGKIGDLDKYKNDTHELACALKKYVSELPEPLLPKPLFEDLSNICDIPNIPLHSIKQKLRKQVDNVRRRDDLVYILKHLYRVVEFDRPNRLSNVTEIWGSTLNKDSLDKTRNARAVELLLDIYGDPNGHKMENQGPMPDVIKDMAARFSKYDNVPSPGHHYGDTRLEGRILEGRILESKTERF